MSVAQIEQLFAAVDRGDGGYPKLKGALYVPPSDRELFAVRCFLCGVHDPDTVATLWAEEKARLAALRAANRRGAKRDRAGRGAKKGG